MRQLEARQKVFDDAVKLMFKQKRKSTDKVGECVYRQEEENTVLMCAFSPQIVQYDVLFEGENASDIIKFHPQAVSKEAEISGGMFCNELQTELHDAISFMEEDQFLFRFYANAKTFAIRWELNISILESHYALIIS